MNNKQMRLAIASIKQTNDQLEFDSAIIAHSKSLNISVDTMKRIYSNYELASVKRSHQKEINPVYKLLLNNDITNFNPTNKTSNIFGSNIKIFNY